MHLTSTSFGLWEETSARRKPTQTLEERANSQQTVTQGWNLTRVPWRCEAAVLATVLNELKKQNTQTNTQITESDTS